MIDKEKVLSKEEIENEFRRVMEIMVRQRNIDVICSLVDEKIKKNFVKEWNKNAEFEKAKYIVHLHKLYGFPDEYRFTTKEKRDIFLGNLPEFYKRNPSFITQDVMSNE